MLKSSRVIILSGPSGCGKSTLIDRVLLDESIPVALAVSATTRDPRKQEVEGDHYYYWSPARFQQAIDQDEFLEWAQVHGHYYGTLKSEVERIRNQGKHVLLEIDVQGAKQVAAKIPDCIRVFLRTSSMEVYEQRLRKRGSDSEEDIQRRVQAAKKELACADEYDYQIVNDDLEQAVEQFRNILLSV